MLKTEFLSSALPKFRCFCQVGGKLEAEFLSVVCLCSAEGKNTEGVLSDGNKELNLIYPI